LQLTDCTIDNEKTLTLEKFLSNLLNEEKGAYCERPNVVLDFLLEDVFQKVDKFRTIDVVELERSQEDWCFVRDSFIPKMLLPLYECYTFEQV
jgi:hypothetical protein